MCVRVTPMLACSRKRAACSSLIFTLASGGPAGADSAVLGSLVAVLPPQALSATESAVTTAVEPVFIAVVELRASLVDRQFRFALLSFGLDR